MILGGGGPTSPSVPTYLQAPKGASAAPPAAEAPSWARPPFEGYIGRDQPDKPVKPRPVIVPPAPAGALPVVETEVKPKGGSPAEKPVYEPKAKIKEPKHPDDPRQLIDYSYERSAPELTRVRKENPRASATVESTGDTATPLTWEEYDKLTTDQRAAVDFNTLLVDARQKDLSRDEKFFNVDQKSYDKDIASMFGAMGGSDVLGVETVKLLKKLDFKAVGQDLDEYLSLDRAISADELKDFSFSKRDLQELANFNIGPLIPGAYDAARTPQNLHAVDTKVIQSALEKYRGTITGGGSGVWDPAAALNLLPANAETPVGYGRASADGSKMLLDKAIEDAYAMLRSNPNENGLAALFADFKDRKWSEAEQRQLWVYVNDRTLREMQYLNDSVAQEIRAALGWK